MTFLFFYETDEQHDELVNIIISESLRHFKDAAHINENDLKKFKNGTYDTPSFGFCSHFVTNNKLAVKIELANALFFEDLENAKCNVYDGNEYIGLHDWISDIEENLYFVPEIKVR